MIEHSCVISNYSKHKFPYEFVNHADFKRNKTQNG